MEYIVWLTGSESITVGNYETFDEAFDIAKKYIKEINELREKNEIFRLAVKGIAIEIVEDDNKMLINIVLRGGKYKII